MIKVNISIEDDKGKKANVEITNDNDNLTKLVIIQQVFSLFGINTDVLEMTKTYNKIGEAYSSFFNQVEPVEPSKEELDNKVEIIKQQMTEGLIEINQQTNESQDEVKEVPEFVITGIKVKDGKNLYRCHYKCEACWLKGTHYLPQASKRTWCHRCQYEMDVYPAHPDGYPNRDNFGNFYRAGSFKDWNLFK